MQIIEGEYRKTREGNIRSINTNNKNTMKK